MQCDGHRPACGQCRRSVIVCEGYAAPNVFMHKSASCYEKTSPTETNEDSKWIRTRGYHGMNFLEPVISPSPPLAQYSWSHAPLIADFLNNILPPTTARRHCVFSWLRDIVLPWKETTDVTKLAITALATGWVGRVERRPDLVNKGLQMYGVATGRYAMLFRLANHFRY